MTSVETLKASTSIPYKLKELLTSLEPVDEKPPALTKWAREVFKEGIKANRSSEEIVEWVETFASAKGYSERQIQRALKDNGAVRHPENDHRSGRRHMSSTYEPSNYIRGLRSLVDAISGLDEHERIQIHSPMRIAERAEPNIQQIASRATEAEKEAIIQYIQQMKALLTKLEETLKKPSIKLER